MALISFLFQISEWMRSWRNRCDITVVILLSGLVKVAWHTGWWSSTRCLAFETKFGLCLPHVIRPNERYVLRATGGRHPGQEELHNYYEILRVAEDQYQRKLVCSRFLSTWFHRYDNNIYIINRVRHSK